MQLTLMKDSNHSFTYCGFWFVSQSVETRIGNLTQTSLGQPDMETSRSGGQDWRRLRCDMMVKSNEAEFESWWHAHQGFRDTKGTRIPPDEARHGRHLGIHRWTSNPVGVGVRQSDGTARVPVEVFGKPLRRWWREPHGNVLCLVVAPAHIDRLCKWCLYVAGLSAAAALLMAGQARQRLSPQRLSSYRRWRGNFLAGNASLAASSGFTECAREAMFSSAGRARACKPYSSRRTSGPGMGMAELLDAGECVGENGGKTEDRSTDHTNDDGDMLHSINVGGDCGAFFVADSSVDGKKLQKSASACHLPAFWNSTHMSMCLGRLSTGSRRSRFASRLRRSSDEFGTAMGPVPSSSLSLFLWPPDPQKDDAARGAAICDDGRETVDVEHGLAGSGVDQGGLSRPGYTMEQIAVPEGNAAISTSLGRGLRFVLFLGLEDELPEYGVVAGALDLQ
ncbi:hypothetical protein FIBSPDRAFT_886398 [Athelia psychrophila]|uniref:Uncharacterized protein n=1 Tax=Athelia psychrophila TaxID=1759441 RepID=A0A166QSX1_9AGAM|nr:hypothetical protein FIBSPDRAFT_886398 [Fibularhizoctonia sp. CBS 109695]